MSRFVIIACVAIITLLNCTAFASHEATVDADEIVIDDFINGLSPKWKAKSFSGFTEYTAVNDEGTPCIKAVSNGTASGYYYEIDFEPSKLPFLQWKWKVDNVVSKGDAFTKEGDDYAARIYVAFPTVFFWNTKVLVYVWGNKLPKDQAITNAYTENFMMIAVESGPDRTGQWITEERNIYEDYRRYFGEDPPKVGAIGFMTDTDDTGEQASACFGAFSVRNKAF